MVSYFIGVTRAADFAGMMNYVRRVIPQVTQYGGEFVLQGPCEAMLEGAFEITSGAVIKFADRQSAMRWYESADYKDLIALRRSVGQSNLWLVSPFDSAAAHPVVQLGGADRYLFGVTKIHRMSGMQTYISRVKPMLAEFGGELVLESRCDYQAEGEVLADNVVVIRFDSAAAARHWYESPDYTTLRASRAGFADSTLWMIRPAAA